MARVVETLKRLREPAAFALVVALLAQVLVALVVLGWNWADVGGPQVAARAEPLLAGSVQILGLAGLVASCLLAEPTPHARLVARLALAAIAATVGLRLAFVLLALGRAGAVDRWPQLVTDLASLVLPALLGFGVGALARGLPRRRGRTPHAPAPAVVGSSRADRTRDEPGELPALDESSAESVARPVPSWPPDAAAGQAWTTAGEAAAGGRGTGWSTPGAESGWYPAMDADEAGGPRPETEHGPRPAGEDGPRRAAEDGPRPAGEDGPRRAAEH